jgi:hypothetical protein
MYTSGGDIWALDMAVLMSALLIADMVEEMNIPLTN